MTETKKNFLTVQDMVLIAVFTALIAICSWITIPAQVPFTLQTFAIFVTAGMLGTKRGTLSVVIYILLGLVGVPVLAGFSGGPGVVIGPTGGYLLGFIFSALIIGVCMSIAERKSETVKLVITVIGMIFGDAVCFVVGTVWFMIVTNTSLIASMTLCVVPFIIPDLVKIVVATIIVNRMKKYVQIFN